MSTEDYIGDIRAINALEARVENLDAECIDLHKKIDYAITTIDEHFYAVAEGARDLEQRIKDLAAAQQRLEKAVEWFTEGPLYTWPESKKTHG